MARHLRPALLACLVTAALALTGCGLDVQGPDPSTVVPTPTADGVGHPGADHGAGATTTTVAPPPAPTYPTTARAYAEAVLAAWKQHLINKIGDLTTALVQDQIISIPGPPNQNWTYQRCDGTAGSSYCFVRQRRRRCHHPADLQRTARQGARRHRGQAGPDRVQLGRQAVRAGVRRGLAQRQHQAHARPRRRAVGRGLLHPLHPAGDLPGLLAAGRLGLAGTDLQQRRRQLPGARRRRGPWQAPRHLRPHHRPATAGVQLTRSVA